MIRRKDNKNRVLKNGEYQKRNGSYEYRWTDRVGKEHSVYAKTLGDLRLKEEEITKARFEGTEAPKKNLSVNELYEMWVKLKKGLKDNTFQNYQYMYCQFVKPKFGKLKIMTIKRSDVRAFYNYLADTCNLKANTIDCVHTVLHQVFELAVEDDYIRYNPSDNALKELKKAHAGDSEKRQGLTRQQQKIFEDYLKKPGMYHCWYPIFETMLWTGMRVGEITGLTWDDIDFENNTISVNHTLVFYKNQDAGKCVFSVNTPKTKAGKRTIYMLPNVKEALLEQKQMLEDLNLTCTSRIDGYTNFVFLNRFGSVQHQGTLNKALRLHIIRDCNYEILDHCKEGEEAVLLPQFSCHILRHTFTTRLNEAGVNLKVMQDVLGHSDVEITMNVYTDATSDLKKSEMEKFAGFYNLG